MVKIKKGSNEFTVSNQTYKTIFKKLGYIILENNADKERTKQIDSTLSEKIKTKSKLENKEDQDIVSSKKLKEEVGEKIENDFGFEKTNKSKRK